jgi:hypothetical protein
MLSKTLPIAENSIERIEVLISKLSSNLNFTEISEFAVAIHELKSFVNEVREMQNLQVNTPNRTNGGRSPYRKFIVVTNDNLHYPMKKWINSPNQPYEQYKSKISHEISRILVNKYNFRKEINDETNEVLHYQP